MLLGPKSVSLIVTFAPPWRWHCYVLSLASGNYTKRAVPDPRPYWRIERWSHGDDDDGDRYHHWRIGGLEVSWFWPPRDFE